MPFSAQNLASQFAQQINTYKYLTMGWIFECCVAFCASLCKYIESTHSIAYFETIDLQNWFHVKSEWKKIAKLLQLWVFHAKSDLQGLQAQRALFDLQFIGSRINIFCNLKVFFKSRQKHNSDETAQCPT